MAFLFIDGFVHHFVNGAAVHLLK